MGALSHPGGLSREEQFVYLVADTTIRNFDLDIGIGRGFGGSEDRWVFKAIVGIPLQ